jgi:hypothetical protein
LTVIFLVDFCASTPFGIVTLSADDIDFRADADETGARKASLARSRRYLDLVGSSS